MSLRDIDCQKPTSVKIGAPLPLPSFDRDGDSYEGKGGKEGWKGDDRIMGSRRRR
jgi:hypothetical protein